MVIVAVIYLEECGICVCILIYFREGRNSGCMSFGVVCLSDHNPILTYSPSFPLLNEPNVVIFR